MAMDALKNLTTHIPDWQKRLEELSSQIEKRQAELAAVAASDPVSAERRSLRNKGSTESLKPKDEELPAAMDAQEPVEPQEAGDVRQEEKVEATASMPPPDTSKSRTSPASPSQETPSVAKQTKDVMATVQSRARAQAKRRHRSASVVSAEGGSTTYRTRSMIIVYYDSYVQGFFDDLVRFVSSSRNLMRKAKMAAKVAQIKRMAEMEVPEDEQSGDDKGSSEALPSLRYMSTRRLGAMSSLSKSGFGPPSSGQAPDAYDSLDKGLEFVQSTCEHGAHQFLRDADCNDEIKKIQARMKEVLDMAEKEMDRVNREEPELAKESGDLGKMRQRRHISMRRELSTSHKDGLLQAADETAKMEVLINGSGDAIAAETPSKPLELDMDLTPDEGIEVDPHVEPTPKLHYRSTRRMQLREVQ